MIRQRLRLIALAVLVVAVASVGWAVGRDGGEAVPPSYLFVFEGQQVELTSDGGSTFELTVPLRGGEHLVTWFTDRPYRNAGHVSMKEFVGLWDMVDDDSFNLDPPNVAIAFDGKTLIATMTEPKILTAANGVELLTTKMELLDTAKLKSLIASGHALTAHAQRAGENTHTTDLTIPLLSVFVDDFVYDGCFSYTDCGEKDWPGLSPLPPDSY